jgi:hypothetical protein
MTYINWTVTVEWMDGEIRRYDVGGTLTPHDSMKETSEGLLVLWHQNGVGAVKEHVATVPLANLREYRVSR